MAAPMQVEAGSELAQSIQNAVQPKLMENGWVAEENDTTLSEYVTMMIVNGKDMQGVTSELGGDLLGVGEDDPAVSEFAQWLFGQVNAMRPPPQDAAAANSSMDGQGQAQQQQAQTAQSQDAQMDDAGAPGEAVPSGPKAMRTGSAGAGRGGNKRMLGQLNNHMNRSDGQDPLRRVRGGATGQQGRINSHANRDPPKGPRGNAANGMQRMMQGRGGHAQAQMAQMNPMSAMNPMMQQPGAMGYAQPQMNMQQMLEMQAGFMHQIEQMIEKGGFQQSQRGGSHQRAGKSLFDRVQKGPKVRGQQTPRHNNGQNGDAASNGGMDVDSEGKTPFDTPCRFNHSCTIPECHFAHSSPAAPPGTPIDTTDTCKFGIACENKKCVGRHPSPAQRNRPNRIEQDCKYWPHCTNPSCPFRHPDAKPCRNGADCKVAGCTFHHSTIMCRYTPCTNLNCLFKHAEGQRGVFKDKVWTPGQEGGDANGDGAPTENDGKSQRFEQFMTNDGEAEELILPGQKGQTQMGGGSGDGAPTVGQALDQANATMAGQEGTT